MTHPTILIAIYAISILALTAILLCFGPRLSRPEIYFSITVPPSFRNTSNALRILRHYRLWVSLHTLIAIALVLAGSSFGRPVFSLFPIAVLWQTVGWLLAFLAARRDVRPFTVASSSVREAEVAPRRAQLPGGLLLQPGPFALLASTALYLRSRWEEIPSRFPVHWGLDGAPDRWSSRTPLAGVSSEPIAR